MKNSKKLSPSKIQKFAFFPRKFDGLTILPAKKKKRLSERKKEEKRREEV